MVIPVKFKYRENFYPVTRNGVGVGRYSSVGCLPVAIPTWRLSVHLKHQDGWRPSFRYRYENYFLMNLFVKNVFHKGQNEKKLHMWTSREKPFGPVVPD
jgi:hypothetical protein